MKISEHFEFFSKWYRKDEAQALVLEYYFVLRSVLRAHPRLRVCLKRCRHCRIFFLVDPRGAYHQSVSCPFGCREAHRRQQSSARGTAYYQTPAGKEKKRRLNQKRSLRQSDPVVAQPVDSIATEVADKTPAEEPAGVFAEARAALTAGAMVEGREITEDIIEYVRVVTSLIEGYRVSRSEIILLLGRILRQHHMAREQRMDYVIRYLGALPPGG